MMEAISALAYIECSAQDNRNVTAVMDTLGKLYFGKCETPLICLYPISELRFSDESPVFFEFCRLFGPGLRKGLPGALPAEIMDALHRMFKAAPPELKIRIKKSLIPAKFFTHQDIFVPFADA
jgi:hypothetical protein